MAKPIRQARMPNSGSLGSFSMRKRAFLMKSIGLAFLGTTLFVAIDRAVLKHVNAFAPSRSRISKPIDSYSHYRQRTKQFAKPFPEESVQEKQPKSRITRIRCENFAGMTNGRTKNAGMVELNLDGNSSHEGNLVCITGETGSGKSLLVSKIADLLQGGKATLSMLQTQSAPTTAEMVLSLHEDAQISFVRSSLDRLGLDPKVYLSSESADAANEGILLRLKRVLSVVTSAKTNKLRLKSTCYINGQSVSLKALKAITGPLVAIVNAPVAASALGKPSLRLSMIDSGIPPALLVWVDKLQKKYRACRKRRESLEQELQNQVLPASMMAADEDEHNEQQFELLRHWIEELDGFERRIITLKETLASCSKTEPAKVREDELGFLLEDLETMGWKAETNEGSSLYEAFLDLHEYLKLLDTRILAATEARDSLASLSSADSARTALDRTRQLLLDAAGSDSSNASKSKIEIATEEAHNLLNLVEDALLECSSFMDNDEKGLVATLQASRRACPMDTEELLEYITEWNTLARKHGVSPYQLPLCHATLRNELDGGIEAGRLLPEAKAAEEKALAELEEGCNLLKQARTKLCQKLSDSITQRLPRLGMENSRFEARIQPIDRPSYSTTQLGTESVDFYLLHDETKSSATKGGKIDSVASSGEKARILLAIECEIPGSISAIGGGNDNLTDQSSYENPSSLDDAALKKASPIAVIYDEIDAHVGGRASISVAQMLYDQSKACQVLSITHSPSLAAIASTHICVHRGGTKGKTNDKTPSSSFEVVVGPVDGVERRKELARMASGDMVAEEAEVFAEALLRDASSIKAQAGNLQP